MEKDLKNKIKPLKLDNTNKNSSSHHIPLVSASSSIIPRHSMIYGMHSTRHSDRPKTNIERIVDCLQEIKERFRDNKDEEFEKKTGWVIKEFLGNKMYLYEESTDSEQSKLLKLYSPDFDKEREKEKLSTKNIITNDQQQCQSDNKISNFSSSQKLTGKLIKPLDYNEFGVNFDVFKYSDDVGRIFLVKQVALAAFAYKDVYSLMKTSYIDNYLEEVRLGYTKETNSYYHNVRLN